MSIWLIFWVLISVSLLGFLGWSLYVLQQQKTVWKAFAAKHKLRFKKKSIMESAEMDGSFGPYKLSFFTGEHYTADMRGLRKLTAVEVSLNGVMPIEGAVASGGMVRLVKELGFKAEIRPEHKEWDEAYIAAGSNRAVLETYLNDERVDALVKLMRIKHLWVVFIFRNERMLLRVDTPNPIASQEYLEKLTKLLIKAADALELKEGEFRTLKAETVRSVSQEAGLVLDDEALEASRTFELEDEDGAAVSQVDGVEVDAPEEGDKPDEKSDVQDGREGKPAKSSGKKSKKK